ncbi:MAG: hypothetical protein L0H59_07800 [Tomitella sp.]|nr:hypothetical protein [Tomitella sp.]
MSTTKLNPQYDTVPAPSFLLTVRTLGGETLEPRMFATDEHAGHAGRQYVRSVWNLAWGEFDNADDPVKTYQDAGGEVTVTRIAVETPPTWIGHSRNSDTQRRFSRFAHGQDLAIGAMRTPGDGFVGTRSTLIHTAIDDVIESGIAPWTVAVRAPEMGEIMGFDLFIGAATSVDRQYLQFTDGVRVEVELIEQLYL